MHVDLPDFRKRLSETVAWCLPRAANSPRATCLRSCELEPGRLEPDRSATVRAVLRARERLVAAATPPAANLSLGSIGGRLLAYFPDADLTDGAAEAATRGYFDVRNTPPWDTWVAYYETPPPAPGANPSYANVLISWVPPALVSLASDGIDVNAELCIQWLEDTASPVLAELRQGGVL